MRVKGGKGPRENAGCWSQVADREGLGWPGAAKRTAFGESHVQGPRRWQCRHQQEGLSQGVAMTVRLIIHWEIALP